VSEAWPPGSTVAVDWPRRELGPPPARGTKILIGEANQEAAVVLSETDGAHAGKILVQVL
jgi:hypothetical protein